MRYHVPPERELIVHVKIRSSGQRCWSLVCYDQYGLPLSQCINDTVAIRNHVTAEGYEVDIRMANRDVTSKGKRSSRSTVTEMDISSCSIDYALFRLVHPQEDAVSYSAPVVDGTAEIDADHKKVD